MRVPRFALFVILAVALGAQTPPSVRYPVREALQSIEAELLEYRQRAQLMRMMLPEAALYQGRLDGVDEALTLVHRMKISPIASTPVADDVTVATR